MSDVVQRRVSDVERMIDGLQRLFGRPSRYARAPLVAALTVDWPVLADLVAAILEAEVTRCTPEHLAAQCAAMDVIRRGDIAAMSQALDRLEQLNDQG